MIVAAASAGVLSAIGSSFAGMCPKLPIFAVCPGFYFPRFKDHSESQQESRRQESRQQAGRVGKRQTAARCDCGAPTRLTDEVTHSFQTALRQGDGLAALRVWSKLKALEGSSSGEGISCRNKAEESAEHDTLRHIFRRQDAQWNAGRGLTARLVCLL